MIITYLKENEQVISIIDGFPRVWEENNQLLIEGGLCPLLNNLTKSGWGYYKDKYIERQHDEHETELPLYMDSLDLEPMDANDLPASEHPAKLIAINPSLAKPATVRRWHLGRSYDFNCLVSQSVKDQFQAGDIQMGDWFVVSFLDENPDGNGERNVAIIDYKIYKSW